MLWTMMLIILILLAALWLASPRPAPWAEHLVRLNPGAGAKAEWMAPPKVVEQVMLDYRVSQEWAAACALNWGKFAGRLDDYATGDALKLQQRALASLTQARSPRLAAKHTASHSLAVRYFSSDGLQCLIIDRQTSRVTTTFDYWSGRQLHRQQLDDRAFVYEMQYELRDRRWKIARLVQELPLGWDDGRARSRVKVSAQLPAAAGRDS